eukprot:72241-Pleurochrysis_carterae.AAC.2
MTRGILRGWDGVLKCPVRPVLVQPVRIARVGRAAWGMRRATRVLSKARPGQWSVAEVWQEPGLSWPPRASPA